MWVERRLCELFSSMMLVPTFGVKDLLVPRLPAPRGKRRFSEVEGPTEPSRPGVEGRKGPSAPRSHRRRGAERNGEQGGEEQRRLGYPSEV